MHGDSNIMTILCSHDDMYPALTCLVYRSYLQPTTLPASETVSEEYSNTNRHRSDAIVCAMPSIPFVPPTLQEGRCGLTVEGMKNINKAIDDMCSLPKLGQVELSDTDISLDELEYLVHNSTVNTFVLYG